MNTNYVGFWRRFAAFFIDAIIISVIQWPVNMLMGTNTGEANINVSSNFGSSFGLSLVISILYWVVFQNKYTQTLGKKAMGIKVIDAKTGQTPNMTTLFLREIIGKFISGIILGIGYLMIIWDGKKQALHDKIAGTYVVYVKG